MYFSFRFLQVKKSSILVSENIQQLELTPRQSALVEDENLIVLSLSDYGKPYHKNGDITPQLAMVILKFLVILRNYLNFINDCIYFIDLFLLICVLLTDLYLFWICTCSYLQCISAFGLDFFILIISAILYFLFILN